MAKSASEKGLFPHLRYAAKSDVGRKRENNEDAFGTFPASGIYCVADGMGGGDDGEVASAAVVDAIRRFTKECPLPREYTYPIDGMVSGISKALNAASAWVAKRTQEKGLKGCGSTFVGVCFDAARPDVAVALHAGDSRLYRIRGKSIVQITKDHSAAGLIGAKSERDVNPMFRGMVLRAVGVQPSVELERTPLPLKEGDRILICSDGLSRMVRDRDMAAIVHRAATLDAAVDGLIAAANDAGGIDNVTAVLVGVGALPPPLPTSRPTDAATVQAMTAGGDLTATQGMTTSGTVAETETISIDFDFVPTTAGDGREDETMATLAVTDSDTEEHEPLQSTAEDGDDGSPFPPQVEKTWPAIMRDRRIVAAVAILLAATCATAVHLSRRSSAKAAATLARAEQEKHRILQKETRQGIAQKREEEQLAAEAKRKADEEAEAKAEAERIERERVAAEEAKAKAEEKAKAEAEARAKAEAEAKRKAEAEAKARAEEATARAKAEEERKERERVAAEKKRLEAEAVARAKAEAEAKAKAEEERIERERIASEKRRQEAEAAARAKAEAERIAAEEKRKAEEKAKAETEARAKAEAERIAAEEKRKAEEKAKAETEARAKAEAEAKRKAEEEAKRRVEEEAKAKAEAAARAKAEAEAKAKVEAERIAAEKKRKAEEEAKAKAERERIERERIVAEKKRREAEAAARAKAEAEAKRKADEEAKTNAGAKRNVKTPQKATVKTARAKAVDELADVLKGTQLEAFMGKCTNYISEEMFNRFNMVRSSLSGRDVSFVIKDVKDVVRRLSYDTSLIVADIEEELRNLPKKKNASLRKREGLLSEEWTRKKDFIWKADAFLKTDLKTDKSYVDCVKKCAEMIRRIPEWLK